MTDPNRHTPRQGPRAGAVAHRSPFAAKAIGLGVVLAAALALAGCQSSAQKAANAGAEAQALFDAQRYREATAKLQAAVAYRDDVPELWLLLGRTRVAAADYAGAYAAYHNALDLDRSNKEALNALAQLTLGAKDYRQAKDYASQLAALNPGDPTPLVIQGSAERGLGLYDEAERIADSVLTRDPGNQYAMALKSSVLQSRNKVQAAIDLLLPTFNSGGAQLPVLQQLQALFRMTADGRRMVSLLEQSARASPRDTAIAMQLVQQLYVVGRPAEATKRLAALYRIDPSDQRRAATVALWMDADLTVDDVLSSLRADKTGGPALTLAAAEFALERGQPARARDLLTPLADLPDVQGALALAEAQLSLWAASATRVSALLARDKTQPNALVAHALAALHRNDSAAALADARLVLRDNPTLPTGYFLLSQIYAAQGDRPSADAAVFDGINALPRNAQMLNAATALFIRTGRAAEALKASRHFSARNPGSLAGWRLVDRLCAADHQASCVTAAKAMEARLRGADVPLPTWPDDMAPVTEA